MFLDLGGFGRYGLAHGAFSYHAQCGGLDKGTGVMRKAVQGIGQPNFLTDEQKRPGKFTAMFKT